MMGNLPKQVDMFAKQMGQAKGLAMLAKPRPGQTGKRDQDTTGIEPRHDTIVMTF
jgi:hypothetical protein